MYVTRLGGYTFEVEFTIDEYEKFLKSKGDSKGPVSQDMRSSEEYLKGLIMDGIEDNICSL